MIQKTELSYPTGEIAYSRFAQLLRRKGFPIKHTIPKHNIRHRLIKTPHIDFYCLFRKNDVAHGTFETFNTHFNQFIINYPEYSGHAESINQEVIDRICNEDEYNITKYQNAKGIVLAYIYGDAKVYICNPFILKKFAEKHNLIRKHQAVDLINKENGIKEAIKETTYHLPFKNTFFINLDDWINTEGYKFITAEEK